MITCTILFNLGNWSCAYVVSSPARPTTLREGKPGKFLLGCAEWAWFKHSRAFHLILRQIGVAGISPSCDSCASAIWSSIQHDQETFWNLPDWPSRSMVGLGTRLALHCRQLHFDIYKWWVDISIRYPTRPLGSKPPVWRALWMHYSWCSLCYYAAELALHQEMERTGVRKQVCVALL